MANFLLKKSYHINNLKVSKFKDLWGSHGVFTTIRLVGKPGKLVIFNNHFINLIKSLKKYKIYSKNMREYMGDGAWHRLITFLVEKQCDIVSKLGVTMPLTGHFFDYRESTLNWCPIGRNAAALRWLHSLRSRLGLLAHTGQTQGQTQGHTQGTHRTHTHRRHLLSWGGEGKREEATIESVGVSSLSP